MSHARWGRAIALAVLVSSAAVLPRASALALSTQQFDFEFEMAATKPTVAEVFVDRGAGFDVLTAMIVPIDASVEPRQYRVPLPAGRYHAVRLDPLADDGEFILQHARVRDRHGRIVSPLLLSRVQASTFVVVKEQSDTRLVAAALPGHGDPQLVYQFDSPLFLWISWRDGLLFAIEALLLTILVAATAYLLQPADKPVRTFFSERRGIGSPRRAIVVAALASTLIAVYPLLLGHSLVTPNNGPTTFVHATAPYAANSTDTEIEDTRGADVRATMWVTLPYAVAQQHALAHGELPWWNRYSETGVPLLGQAQTSFFDPLQWLVLLGDVAFGADLKYVAARFVFVLGTGLAAFAATGSLAGAMLVTIAAPFMSHFLFRFNDAIYFSVVYAPWVLLAYAWLLRATTRRQLSAAAAALLVATALLMFSSSPKEAFALLPTLHLAGVAALGLHAWRSSAWREVGIKMALVLIASVGAALLTAPHWLIFLETLSGAFTAYDKTAFEFARAPQAVTLFAGAFVPTLFHTGLNPVLVVAALLAVTRPRVFRDLPLVGGCAIAAALSLVVAFGAIPEPWLMPLPLMSRIHHIGATFVTAALPLLLILSAAGGGALEHLSNTSMRMRGPMAAVIGGAFFVAVLAIADLSHPTFGLALTACVWSGVLCYLLLAIPEWPGRVTLAITAVVVAALLLPAGLHLRTGTRLLDSLLMQPRLRASLTDIPATLAPVRDATADPARVVGMNGVLPGGVPTLLSLESITGGDALFSPYTFWLGKQFDPEFFPLFLRPRDPRDPRLAPLLDLWGVRWAVTPAQTGSSERLALVERPSAWPRAFFVDRVEHHEDRRVFLSRLVSDPRPFGSVLADDSVAADLTRDLQGPTSVVLPGREYLLTANTTAFTIAAPTAGVVVLNEGYWPGVTATLNERSATVFRINESMRGVVVPGGTWRITFSYRPVLWDTASLMALAGAVTALALAVAAVVRIRSAA